MDELVGRLAVGIAAIHAVLDPSTVIIGGGLSRAGAQLLAPLQAHLARQVARPPRLALSSFGEDAVAIGAVTAAIREWEANAFTMFSGQEI